MTDHVEIVPPPGFRVDVTVPGSKSLAHRALLCAALAEGRSLLSGVSPSDDVKAMVGALRSLGAVIEPLPRMELAVTGNGGRFASGVDLDLGGSGTALRFLVAATAASEGRWHLTGDARLQERPVGGLVDALRKLGAGIGYHAAEGRPPLHVEGKGLAGGTVDVDAATSSQYLSALLLAAPRAAAPVELRAAGPESSRGYVDLTVAVMQAFGVRVSGRWRVEPSAYRAADYAVAGDAAAAGYWWAMAAATGGRARVSGPGDFSVQPEAGFLDDLAALGAKVAREPGAATVEGGPLRGIDATLGDRPDSVPTLAVLACFATGPTRIRGVAHLRAKESDRLGDLAKELAKIGARVVEHPDGLEIHPPAKVQAATIDPHGDHRLAMAFAVAGLAVPGIRIQDPGCVGKSYPGFWQSLRKSGVQSLWKGA